MWWRPSHPSSVDVSGGDPRHDPPGSPNVLRSAARWKTPSCLNAGRRVGVTNVQPSYSWVCQATQSTRWSSTTVVVDVPDRDRSHSCVLVGELAGVEQFLGQDALVALYFPVVSRGVGLGPLMPHLVSDDAGEVA